MVEIEYDSFLQNKIETITYNPELLTVQKIDKKLLSLVEMTAFILITIGLPLTLLMVKV